MCDIICLGRTAGPVKISAALIGAVAAPCDGADKSSAAMADQHVIMMTLAVMKPR